MNVILDQVNDQDDWRELLRVFFKLLQQNPTLVYHVFDSISKDRLERYMFASVKQPLIEYIERRLEKEGLQIELVPGLTEMYSYSFLGLALEFVWNNMEADVDEMIDTVSPLFSRIRELLILDQNSRKSEK